MEDCGLASEAGLIDCCAGIDVSSSIEQKSDRCQVSEFRGNMQKRSSLKQEVAPPGLAHIEFGETPIHECGIRFNLISQTVEPAA